MLLEAGNPGTALLAGPAEVPLSVLFEAAPLPAFGQELGHRLAASGSGMGLDVGLAEGFGCWSVRGGEGEWVRGNLPNAGRPTGEVKALIDDCFLQGM